jgi:hypothetical protein
MHFSAESVKGGPMARVWKTKPPAAPVGSIYAIEEINAYIAIRDQLLAEAEELRTRAKIDSVIVANDFVDGCLKAARSPYDGQCLPEADAARERKRCLAVTNRVNELRRLAIRANPVPRPSPRKS